MTKRDFHGEDFYKFMIHEYEVIRVRRKSLKGKPNQYDLVEIQLDRIFESFYKTQMD